METTPAFVASLISAIVYCIPVALLIWKAAKLDSRVTENTKDIDDLKKLVGEQNKSIIEQLQNMNNTMQSLKIDVEVIKQYRRKEVEGK